MRLLVFRGERASKSPEVVFTEGLKPRGNELDLLTHVTLNKAETIYVSATISIDIAEAFAGRNGFIYEIETDRGIDVNLVLGVASPFPEQQEIAIPNGIFSEEIVEAYPKKAGALTGEFIANPVFRKVNDGDGTNL